MIWSWNVPWSTVFILTVDPGRRRERGVDRLHARPSRPGRSGCCRRRRCRPPQRRPDAAAARRRCGRRCPPVLAAGAVLAAGEQAAMRPERPRGRRRRPSRRGPGAGSGAGCSGTRRPASAAPLVRHVLLLWIHPSRGRSCGRTKTHRIERIVGVARDGVKIATPDRCSISVDLWREVTQSLPRGTERGRLPGWRPGP